MKYNLDWIIEKFDKQEKIKYLFFWGHQPNIDQSVGKSCLSQWWEQAFTFENLTFSTAEHWMMYQKALLFKDEEVAAKILNAKTPGEAKQLGREVRNFVQEVWEEHRYAIVLEGNILKFSQNEDLKNFLLNTGNRVLVEASPVDRIWGIGLSKDADNIEDPNTWKGLNLLGFVLMETRERI